MTPEIERLLCAPLPSTSLPSSLVIYGAGNKGREVYRFLTSVGYTVSGFLDTNAKPGQSCDGIAVSAPADWLAYHQSQQFGVVVAIHMATDMVPLLAQIRNMGFAQVVNIVELYNLFPGELPNHFWLAPRSYYRGLLTQIEAVAAILADDRSRQWLEATLAFRLSGDYARLPPPQFGDQYRAADLPRWRNPVRFVDCGAFDGDTLAEFAADGYRFQAIAAFEPDLGNFRALAAHAPDFGQAVCFPCGVGSKTELQRFAAALGTASRVFAQGESVIQCVAIDETLAGFEPTLIKMDIEGAELEALHGARKTIAASRPGLAIALYHHPAHLWQIPLLIHSWGLGYRLFMRVHAHNTYEAVLYALPAN